MIEVEKIPPARLSASGYADSKPLVPNTSEGNRAINRRVDIVVLKTEQSKGKR
jgi:chemotaxis protein MotB